MKRPSALVDWCARCSRVEDQKGWVLLQIVREASFKLIKLKTINRLSVLLDLIEL